MANILYSAHWCSPYSTAAHGGFNWLKILLKEHKITVFTIKQSEEGLLKYYNNKLPSNLKIITFNDESFLANKLRIGINFNYYAYNQNIKKYIKSKSFNENDFDFILHKNPMSFRYLTCLYRLKIPFFIGPIGGGVQVPKVLNSYFKNESWIKRLRKYDRLLFKLPKYKRYFKRADKIFISFDYILDILPKKYHHKATTIYNSGISFDDKLIVRKKKPDDKINILYVGRLARYKGAELAIKAINQLKNMNIHYDIVGHGEEYDYLRNLIDDLDLNDKVTLHGYVDMKIVKEYYLKADIFCMPTINEAGGNVFLEAMKYSLPIVIVDHGGPKYICPKEGALRVPINQPETMIEDLAKHLSTLVSSSELRTKMGEINYEHCKNNYSWDGRKERILALFKDY